jgi:hypothetical protein
VTDVVGEFVKAAGDLVLVASAGGGWMIVVVGLGRESDGLPIATLRFTGRTAEAVPSRARKRMDECIATVIENQQMMS